MERSSSKQMAVECYFLIGILHSSFIIIHHVMTEKTCDSPNGGSYNQHFPFFIRKKILDHF